MFQLPPNICFRRSGAIRLRVKGKTCFGGGTGALKAREIVTSLPVLVVTTYSYSLMCDTGIAKERNK